MTNTVNSKVYVGQTVHNVHDYLEHRLSKQYSPNDKRVLHRAIAKYGSSVWDYKVIYSASSRTELDNLEIAAIEEHNSRNPDCGYNMTKGGERGPGWPKGNNNPSKHMSAETKAKISASSKGRKLSMSERLSRSEFAKTRVGYKNPFFGRKHSPETIEKMRKAAQGRKLINNEWAKQTT